MKPFLALLLFLTSVIGNAQIKSGPMLGYNTMKEVLIWVQTEKSDSVILKYFPTENPSKTSTVRSLSSERNGFTNKLIAANLEPGTSYEYELIIQNKQAAKGNFTTQSLWQHRTDPPNFKFALGSCAYTNEPAYDRPGKSYGQGNEIYQSIVAQNPEFMLWLGDNVYLREPDWSSRSGIYHRYTHFKSLPEIQSLWKNMHHYAIWDDHDFGPNDADRSFVGKEISLEAFQDFWGNYEYGINGKPGITTQFSYNDLDFFLLDNRYYRSPNNRKTGERFILGEEQIEWLIDALVSSKASFKIVAIGGQLLSPAAVWENHATYPEERQKIIDLIEKEGIKNVVFLNGDRHKTELTKMELANGNVLYDYTCSPLSSKAYNSSDEGNTLRVEGTHVSTQNFGIIELEGPFKERQLLLKNYDANGKLMWEHKIKRQ